VKILKYVLITLFFQTLFIYTSYADAITDLIPIKMEEKSVTNKRVITTKTNIHDDKKIRIRLEQIFSELDALKNIKVDVSNGVVELTGNTYSNAETDIALQLASQVEGVVEVENTVLVNSSLAARLKNTNQHIISIGKQILSGLPIFLVSLLNFILFCLIGDCVSERKRLYGYFTKNKFIAALLGQIVHLIFIIIGLMIALMLLDATALMGTILGAAGVVGFAVRDTVENYIASVLLSLRNPFDVNDFVQIDGYEGNVVRLISKSFTFEFID